MQESISDVFNGHLFGAAPSSEAVRFNEIEQYVYDRTNNMILGNMKIDALPRLSSHTTTILEKLNDPKSSVEEITRYIHEDPVIAAEVIKLSNSAYFKLTSKELTHLNEAIVILGFDNLKSMIANVLMKPVIQIKPIYFKMFGKQLWVHSQDCAIACKKQALAQDVDPFAAYLIGLVHDLGKVVIFNLLLKAFREVNPDIAPRPHVFARIIAEHTAKLSHLVAQSWDFPKLYLDALRDQEVHQQLEKMSSLGKNLYYGNFFAEIKFLREKGSLPEEVIECHILDHGFDVERFNEIYPFEQAA